MIYYSRIYTIGIKQINEYQKLQCEAKLCFWSAVKLFSMFGDKYICMLEVYIRYCLVLTSLGCPNKNAVRDIQLMHACV